MSRFVSNSIWLYVVKVLTLVAPLFAIPILSRGLGKDGFSAYLFYQSLGLLLAVLIEFGFSLSGVRSIARLKGYVVRVRYFGAVFNCKLLLMLPVTFISFSLCVFWEGMDYFVSVVFFVASIGFSPTWYYQGRLDMLAVAKIETVAIVGFVAPVFLVFLYLDGYYILLAQACVRLLVYMVCSFSIGGIKVGFGRFERLVLAQSKTIFYFRLVSSVYSKGAGALIALVVGPLSSANYLAAEKIAKTAAGLHSPVSQVLFPALSAYMKSDMRLARKYAFRYVATLLPFVLLISALLYSFSGLIVELIFGQGFEESGEILRVLAWLLPASLLSNFFGVQVLVPLGKDIYFNRVVLSAAILGVVMIVVGAMFFGGLGAAFAIVMVEWYVAIMMLVVGLCVTNFYGRKHA